MDRVDLTPNEIASLLGATDFPQSQLPIFQQPLRDFYIGFAELLRSELAILIEREISVTWKSASRLTYAELVLSAQERRTLGRAETRPEFGPVFVQLDPSFADHLVHLMLGGQHNSSTSSTGHKQGPSEIENRLAEALWQQLTVSYCKLWSQILPVEPIGVHHDLDLNRLRLLPAQQNLTVLKYAITVGGSAAELTWCFAENWPVRAVQQAVAPYCPSAVDGGSSSDRDDGDHELIAELASTQLSADELRELKVGDVLQTDTDVGEPLVLRLDGAARFRANLGKVGDQKAVQIREVLEDPESPSDPPADAPAEEKAEEDAG